MEKAADGGPAFPVLTSNGMSLRDWFAGVALQGLIANAGALPTDDLSFAAYDYADAMLKERSKLRSDRN